MRIETPGRRRCNNGTPLILNGLDFQRFPNRAAVYVRLTHHFQKYSIIDYPFSS